VSAVAVAVGVSRSTVTNAVAELELPAELPEGRSRRAGGGRKNAVVNDPGLSAALNALVDPETRGDPESPLRWTCKSTRQLATALTADGHPVSDRTVAALLHRAGYSLQANAKTTEGSQHPDRDGQFAHINTMVRRYLKTGDPVISVDTKKKELVGSTPGYKNNGRDWQPQGDPVRVGVHDFPDPAVPKAVPYGIYDLAANTGWVSVGCDGDTAAFAVETLRRWWHKVGQVSYPKGKRLLICADAGGSNGYRVRLWKVELARLATEIGRPITVCHFPPGTSSRVGDWRGCFSGVVGPGAFMFRRFPGRLRHPSDLDPVLRPVSSPRHLDPGMRFSRTRLTDAVHRRHSASPASPERAWGRQRSRQDRPVPDGSGRHTTPPTVRNRANVCASSRRTVSSAFERTP
jgi:transposase